MTFKITNSREYKGASNNDLIEMVARPGCNPPFEKKRKIECLVYGICNGKYIHVSGPTGSNKTNLILSFEVEQNFRSVARHLGFPDKPVKIFPVEMTRFESPSECWSRRTNNEDGKIIDEHSVIINALLEGVKLKEDFYVVIYLQELGRTFTAAIQGALLNIISPFVELNGEKIDTRGICIIADSNYAAPENYELVDKDDALFRRFDLRIRTDYLKPAEEESIVAQIIQNRLHIFEADIDHELIKKIVNLGHIIRLRKRSGKLQTIAPPTIQNFLVCYELARSFPKSDLEDIIGETFFGDCHPDDLEGMQEVLDEGLFSTKEEYFNSFVR